MEYKFESSIQRSPLLFGEGTLLYSLIDCLIMYVSEISSFSIFFWGGGGGGKGEGVTMCTTLVCVCAYSIRTGHRRSVISD